MGGGRGAGGIGLLFLASVGALVLGGATVAAILFGLLRFATSGEDDPDSYLALPSPDGAMKAVQVTSSGGGAAGYCVTRVAVTRAEARNEDAAKRDVQVFSAACANFSLRDGAMARSPAIAWISPSRLRITFSTQSMRGEMRDVQLRSLDSSGTVAVEFVASD